MELKPQDLLVLLKVVAHPQQRWTYAALGVALSMSPSETHACVKRAVASGLAVAKAQGGWSPVRPALGELREQLVSDLPIWRQQGINMAGRCTCKISLTRLT